MKIDSATALVNGVPVRIDAPATIMHSRTMVPISFIMKELRGLRLEDIEWDGLKREVTIRGVR